MSKPKCGACGKPEKTCKGNCQKSSVNKKYHQRPRKAAKKTVLDTCSTGVDFDDRGHFEDDMLEPMNNKGKLPEGYKSMQTCVRHSFNTPVCGGDPVTISVDTTRDLFFGSFVFAEGLGFFKVDSWTNCTVTISQPEDCCAYNAEKYELTEGQLVQCDTCFAIGLPPKQSLVIESQGGSDGTMLCADFIIPEIDSDLENPLTCTPIKVTSVGDFIPGDEIAIAGYSYVVYDIPDQETLCIKNLGDGGVPLDLVKALNDDCEKITPVVRVKPRSACEDPISVRSGKLIVCRNGFFYRLEGTQTGQIVQWDNDLGCWVIKPFPEIIAEPLPDPDPSPDPDPDPVDPPIQIIPDFFDTNCCPPCFTMNCCVTLDPLNTNGYIINISDVQTLLESCYYPAWFPLCVESYEDDGLGGKVKRKWTISDPILDGEDNLGNQPISGTVRLTPNFTVAESEILPDNLEFCVCNWPCILECLADIATGDCCIPQAAQLPRVFGATCLPEQAITSDEDFGEATYYGDDTRRYRGPVTLDTFTITNDSACTKKYSISMQIFDQHNVSDGNVQFYHDYELDLVGTGGTAINFENPRVTIHYGGRRNGWSSTAPVPLPNGFLGGADNNSQTTIARETRHLNGCFMLAPGQSISPSLYHRAVYVSREVNEPIVGSDAFEVGWVYDITCEIV